MSKAITIARVYSDRSDRLQYKTIFDELQRVVFESPVRSGYLTLLALTETETG